MKYQVLAKIAFALYVFTIGIFLLDLYDFYAYPEQYEKLLGGEGPHAGAWAYKSSFHYMAHHSIFIMWLTLGIVLIILSKNRYIKFFAQIHMFCFLLPLPQGIKELILVLVMYARGG